MRRGQRQQGFTLVETAIIVAVVGLVLGAIIIPVVRQIEKEAYESTSGLIVDAIDAVVGYAVTHRTNGVNVRYLQLNDETGTEWMGHNLVSVPAGRPYLPCPDIDLDGVEDRWPIYVPASPASDAVLFDMGGSFAHRENLSGPAIETRELDSAGDDGKLSLGKCLSSYGMLPWATLGLRHQDSWGGLLTYIVSPQYSTGAYGFDQATRATGFNQLMETRFVLEEDGDPVGRLADLGLAEGPIIVCKPTNTSTDCTPPNSLDLSTASPTLTMQYAAGYQDYSAQFLHNHNVLEATDGLPFVIISHGANSRGTSRTLVGGLGSECVQIDTSAPDALRSAELVNASYGACNDDALLFARLDLGSLSVSDFNPNAFQGLPGPAPGNGLASVSGMGARPEYSITSDTTLTDIYNRVYAFGRVPLHDWERNASGRYRQIDENNFQFDDVVGWLTRRELARRMSDAGVFPLPDTFAGLAGGQALFYDDR